MDFDLKLLLEKIHAITPDNRLRIMNVCGGHERTLTRAGLRTVLPPQIELVPGPGCPVCICPEEKIHAAIQLALHEDVTVATFGDMLRVPVNGSKPDIRSLEQARSAGADIRAVGSPQQVIEIANRTSRRVIFFAAGFETTMAPVAAMLQQSPPENLMLLGAGRRTWPAVKALLNETNHRLDGLIAPGHVATIMGSEEWRFVADDFALPVAVSGFTVQGMLKALLSILTQIKNRTITIDNCYPEAVRAQGNPAARRILYQTFVTVDASWRGIGILPDSGFTLSPEMAHYDATRHYQIPADIRKRRGDNPPGCDCASVVTGKLRPDQCRLYGSACMPGKPVGPCMVSEEGACRIWWAGGVRQGTSMAT